MDAATIIQIVEWAGILTLAVYALVSAYRDIVEILYEKGFPLPRAMTNAILNRKKREIDHILEKTGIISRFEQHAQLSQALDISERRPASSYGRELERIIKLCFSSAQTRVGKTYAMRFPYFIDLMGACTDYRTAERCARILANFIRDEAMKALADESSVPLAYDKVVVPKSGTPTLGFLLGHILRVPSLFFRGVEEPKYRDPAPVEAFFDGELVEGDKAILVDDSTTGGRMFSEAIQKIREAGAEVRHAFVLFEPLGKDARGLLRHAGVELHSIFKVDEGFLERLRKPARRSGAK